MFAISFATPCRYLVAQINVLIPSVGSVILWLCKIRTRLCNYGLASRLQSCDSGFGNSWARLGLQRPSVSVLKVLNLLLFIAKALLRDEDTRFKFWYQILKPWRRKLSLHCSRALGGCIDFKIFKIYSHGGCTGYDFRHKLSQTVINCLKKSDKLNCSKICVHLQFYIWLFVQLVGASFVACHLYYLYLNLHR